MELLAKPSLIEPIAGVYGWYFDDLSLVPTDGLATMVDGFRLLYVGIAPSAAESHATMQQRIIGSHLKGNASQSTLRRSLGCLLSDQLGISLQRVRGRLHFREGEEKLSEWLRDHARIAWVGHPTPWEIESAVITHLDAPLNLAHNAQHRFHPVLKGLRKELAAVALAQLERLEGLAVFLPIFQTSGFEFARCEQANGNVNPIWIWSESAKRFVETCYRLGWVTGGNEFNWPEWAQTADAKSIAEDPGRMARATPEDLSHILTVLIRQDRFVDGLLVKAFSAGVLVRVVARAETLLEEARSQGHPAV
ncbi:MAG: GIY-YIG nuclease family protein [Terriglobales bacterium]